MVISEMDIGENMMRRLNLGDCLRRSARRYANKEAIVYKDERTTYGEFNERVNRFGRAMMDLGYARGTKIAFIGLNCGEFLVALFAAAKTGMIMVPLNPLLRPNEVEFAIDHADAQWYNRG